MNEMNIQPNPTPKIQKSWMFNPRSMSNLKSWIFGFLFDDWIGMDFLVQFNPITLQKFNKNP
jgi:hypothetical protein